MLRNPIIRALKNTGCIIVKEDYDGFIVSTFGDDQDLMFSEVQVIKGNITDEVVLVHDRFDFEQASFKFLKEHSEVKDCRVMFNIAQLFVIDKSRAMLRHVINWPNSNDIKCRWDIIKLDKEE